MKTPLKVPPRKSNSSPDLLGSLLRKVKGNPGKGNDDQVGIRNEETPNDMSLIKGFGSLVLLSNKVAKDDVRLGWIKESKLTPILEDFAEMGLSSTKKVSKDDSFVERKVEGNLIGSIPEVIPQSQIARQLNKVFEEEKLP